MLIAGLAPIGEFVSEKIIDAITEVHFFDFVDGNPKIKRLIQRIIEKKGNTTLDIVLNAVRIYRILKQNLGLNPGNTFEAWISGLLKESGIFTLEQAERTQNKNAGRTAFHGPDDDQFNALLAIISSEITTHTKAEFPRMAGLYWKDPGRVPPALL